MPPSGGICVVVDDEAEEEEGRNEGEEGREPVMDMGVAAPEPVALRGLDDK